MYDRSARLYDALYEVLCHAGDAARLRDIIGRLGIEDGATLLDVGCGTGLHLERLREWYEVAGADIAPAMVEVARARLPGVPVHQADMTELDLGRRFDVVTCLFSSIGYVRTVERLRGAVGAMARHLRPGGVLVIEPWILPENWVERHVGALFVDDSELKIARMNAHFVRDGVSVLDMHHLVGTPDGVEHFVERHELGLFSHEQYLGAIREAGLVAEHDAEGLMGRGLYIGLR